MRVILLILALALSACDKNYFYQTSPTDVGLQNPNTPAAARIEFRVTGNASSVRIRHTNQRDGTTQVVTALPYFISFSTAETLTFLSLEAAPLTYPALVTTPHVSLQIFVDGTLFRETQSYAFFDPLAVSGTWRK